MKHYYQLKLAVIYLSLSYSIFFVAGCKKDLSNYITTTSESKDPIPAYNFSTWETAQWMPSNPSSVVGVPWSGQVGGVDGNINQDIKKSDGWKEVYCTFSPSASPYFSTMPPGGLYFAIYNVYRGLLRFYLYIPPGWIASSTNIVHGLSLYPQGSTASPMLNFEGSDVVDVTHNTSAVMKTNNQQVQALANWVVCQYEIAYDPNINSTSWPNLALQWNSQTINITKITIDGTDVGTITGTINTPASGFSPGAFFGNLGAAGLQIFGLNQLSSIKPTPGSALANYITNINAGVQSSLGNSLTGLFNAILGGSANSQEVNLTTKSNITLTGNLTSSTGMTSPYFVIPGQSNQTTANGLIPQYTSPMGVFNLTGRPTIHVNSTHLSGHPNNPNHFWDYRPDGDYYSNTMTIDQTVLNSVFVTNPALNGSANISIIRQDILLDIVGDDWYYQTIPTIENIGDRKIIRVTGSFDGIKWNPTSYSTGMVRLWVQISSPTNAFQTITIPKTFLANIVSP